ncbi:CRISPR-associated protein Cas4 [Candidatus Bipolaricaulota bacterium]|nr:CRISPR-associated protein Cas4 [Candidatus Bipolaricaulota bacterium]
MTDILEHEEVFWAQEELVPISALQHYVYCPRQCALIHVEQIWEENIYTLRGRRAHERVETPEGIVREGIRVEYALPLWSRRLGLVGRADVVEFPDGVPYPVEHKVGPRRARHADEVQLCAQALCLEEMLGVGVPKGALFYRASRRRREVAFTPELRAEVEQVVQEVRDLLQRMSLPPPVADTRCRDCSLIGSCLPFVPKTLADLRQGGGT